MRLPVTPQLSTKDGASNKNARMTNVLREKDKAVIRPGLSLVLDYSGVGDGLVSWDDKLLGVFDDVVYDLGGAGADGTEGDGAADLGSVAGTPVSLVPPDWDTNFTYPVGALVTGGGIVWASSVDDNIGNTPGLGSAEWEYDSGTTWSPATTYDIGDDIITDGAQYYSAAPNNINSSPTDRTTPISQDNPNPGGWSWMTSAPGPTRYYMNGVAGGAYFATQQAVLARLCADQPDYAPIDQIFYFYNFTVTGYTYDNYYLSSGNPIALGVVVDQSTNIHTV